MIFSFSFLSPFPPSPQPFLFPLYLFFEEVIGKRDQWSDRHVTPPRGVALRAPPMNGIKRFINHLISFLLDSFYFLSFFYIYKYIQHALLL